MTLLAGHRGGGLHGVGTTSDGRAYLVIAVADLR